MTDHPMQPTPRQIREWFDKSTSQAECTSEMTMPAAYVARLAYAAGADAELEACDEWLCEAGLHGYAYLLRRARRPKPPSLKDQALSVLPSPGGIAMKHTFHPDHIELLRRAIEALPEEVL